MTDTDKTDTPPAQDTNTRYHLFSIIAGLMALIALAIAIYALFMERQLHRKIISQKVPMMQVQALQNTFDKKINELQQAVDKQQTYNKEDWQVFKARYFLELAQIQTHWDDNPQTSVTLLQQADNLLSQINQTDMFPIRQTLASEIAALKTQPALDLPGLLSQLDAINENIDTLKIAIEKKLPQATTPVNKDSSWKAHLQNSLHTLEKMVVIQKQDQIQPVMSTMQVALLKENIRMNLNQAQWGLLKRNQLIYQHGLQQAITIIQKNFDTQADETKAVLKQLRKPDMRFLLGC